MKHFFKILISMSMLASAYAAPVVVRSPVNHLFIPKGFDNNDNVEVVVSGTFPNTCYSRNKVIVVIKENKIDVQVSALFNEANEERCEDLEINYLENVTVGNLQAGDYEISVNQQLKDKLTVSESSSSSVDDHLYAQVDYINLGFTGGASGEIFLVGRTADCVEFDRVELVSNAKDTLSILPIMKIVSNSCAKQRVSFNIPVKFNTAAFSQDQVLLFVKTMDGKSIHTLMDK